MSLELELLKKTKSGDSLALRCMPCDSKVHLVEVLRADFPEYTVMCEISKTIRTYTAMPTLEDLKRYELIL